MPPEFPKKSSRALYPGTEAAACVLCLSGAVAANRSLDSEGKSASPSAAREGPPRHPADKTVCLVKLCQRRNSPPFVTDSRHFCPFFVIKSGQFSEKNLRRMMQFVTVFPDRKIVVSLLRQFSFRRVSSGCVLYRKQGRAGCSGNFWCFRSFLIRPAFAGEAPPASGTWTLRNAPRHFFLRTLSAA